MGKRIKFTDRRICVGLSKTINIGNYESMKVHANAEANISDDADFDEACDALLDDCIRQVIKYEEEVLNG